MWLPGRSLISGLYSSNIDLHCGAAVWGGDMGGVPDDRAGAERISPWGGEKAHRQTSAEREGWEVALPLTRGGHEGGGPQRCPHLNSEKAENGRAVYFYATASGPMRGTKTERGSEGYVMVVGTVGNWLGEQTGEGNRDRSDVRFGIRGRHGGGGGATVNFYFTWTLRVKYIPASMGEPVWYSCTVIRRLWQVHTIRYNGLLWFIGKPCLLSFCWCYISLNIISVVSWTLL